MKRLLSAFAILLLAIAGCNPDSGGKSAPAAPPNQAPMVATVAVTSSKLQTIVALPAQLTPYE